MFSTLICTPIDLLCYRNSLMMQKNTMKPDWRRWTFKWNQRLHVSTSTNGWRKTLKVKTSNYNFSLSYFMFLAALGTAEMAMFGYMGYWVELYCNLKKRLKEFKSSSSNQCSKGPMHICILGKIKDLVPQGAIDAMTRLVLVNAIYFKGNWEKKFPKDATRDGQFKLNKVRCRVLIFFLKYSNLSCSCSNSHEIWGVVTCFHWCSAESN